MSSKNPEHGNKPATPQKPKPVIIEKGPGSSMLRSLDFSIHPDESMPEVKQPQLDDLLDIVRNASPSKGRKRFH